MIHGSNWCPLTTTVYGRLEYGSLALYASVLPAAVLAPANWIVNVAWVFVCRACSEASKRMVQLLTSPVE